MPATYGGMTFGASWSWESAWQLDTTNNIYFSSAASNTQSFGFVQPEVFVSLQVFGDAAGTLTLTDDQGQITTFQVAKTGTIYGHNGLDKGQQDDKCNVYTGLARCL